MLGVFFLLVIFLLLSSALVFTPGVQIELPTLSPPLAGTTDPTLVVVLDANGLKYYDNQIILEEGLRAQLVAAARKSKRPITLVIQADKAVKYEAVLRLGKLARDAGIHKAVFAALPAISFSPTDKSREP